MLRPKLTLPLAALVVAFAFVAAPAGAKSSGSSHSSSSHSGSSSHNKTHTTSAPRPPTTIKSTVNPDGTRTTLYSNAKQPVVHACKTASCRSKHPTGFYAR